MAVKIRLMRVGKKKQPTYRVVVADSRSPRNGRFIEIIGQYEPRREPSAFNLDDEKALAWLDKGALPSEQVLKILTAAGIWERHVAKNPNAKKISDALASRSNAKAERAAAAAAKAKAEADAAEAAAKAEAAAAKAEAEAAAAAAAAAASEEAASEDAAADASTEADEA
ncbi:MAG: 30S ribosomal protein S16 [Acidimicrobiia bacterium]